MAVRAMAPGGVSDMYTGSWSGRHGVHRWLWNDTSHNHAYRDGFGSYTYARGSHSNETNRHAYSSANGHAMADEYSGIDRYTVSGTTNRHADPVYSNTSSTNQHADPATQISVAGSSCGHVFELRLDTTHGPDTGFATGHFFQFYRILSF